MSFFGLFKNKQPQNLIADYSVIGTDIHSHLIPGIDDGVKTLSESIEIIRGLSELGYSKIVTTPHIMADYYKNTPEIILSGLDVVKNKIAEEKIPVEINAAAEYYFDFDFQKKIGKEQFLTLPGGYLLFEFSYFSPPQDFLQGIFDLQISGYKTILAHPERYSYWHNNLEIFEQLKDRSVYLQLNLLSLVGEYSIQVKKMAEKLIDAGFIDFVATDIHNPGQLIGLNLALSNKHLNKLIEAGSIKNFLIKKEA